MDHKHLSAKCLYTIWFFCKKAEHLHFQKVLWCFRQKICPKFCVSFLSRIFSLYFNAKLPTLRPAGIPLYICGRYSHGFWPKPYHFEPKKWTKWTILAPACLDQTCFCGHDMAKIWHHLWWRHSPKFHGLGTIRENLGPKLTISGGPKSVWTNLYKYKHFFCQQPLIIISFDKSHSRVVLARILFAEGTKNWVGRTPLEHNLGAIVCVF